MKFLHRKQEDKYEFHLDDGVCVELSYLPSPFYSTLRVIVDNIRSSKECEIDVDPNLAKGIKQYYKTHFKTQVSSELFVSQLIAWGLREVALHVSNTMLSS